ncbi:MAG: serine--tRNA ligase [Euryarchaeota archaeon]|nr:serine--tRNA ligase [Euryarchaeota archaeon]
MLDTKLVRESPDLIRRDLEKRNASDKLELLEQVIGMDAEWRRLLDEANRLRAERNAISKKIAEAKKKGQDASALTKEASALPGKIEEANKRIEELRGKIDAGLMRLPNILHESVPIGKDDSGNEEVRAWGTRRQFDFELKSHAELAEALMGADFERARKVSGAGFVYLLGDIALLDQALMRYGIDFLVGKGYTLVEPPIMMHRAPYEGVVDLSDFESVMYKIEGEDEYLIATSEHPMGAMFMDEIIDEARLPVRLAGVSPCFRREIGAHGVDTKGLFRMHQFNKIEQFVFCRPEESWQMHEEIIANAEALFQGLGLPYRVVNVCTGDIGTVAAKKYDLEAWSPRQQKYMEVVSCSNCTDYQARRLKLRCGKVGGDKRVPHTLNSTAIATSRALVAILENCQNADGSIAIPEALRKHMGGRDRIG